MSEYLSLLVLSIAIGLDGVSVGLAYGLRKTKIPVLSLFVIGLCSFIVVFSVMSAGITILEWLSPPTSQKIGASVLIFIGVITLWRTLTTRSQGHQPIKPENKEEKPISQIKVFGIIIQILRDPSYADSDRSGHITGWEAVLLGLALSLDAFGAGMSFALLGYPPLFTSALVAVTSSLLLFTGTVIGERCEKMKWFRSLTWLPPVLLICIGLLKGVS